MGLGGICCGSSHSTSFLPRSFQSSPPHTFLHSSIPHPPPVASPLPRSPHRQLPSHPFEYASHSHIDATSLHMCTSPPPSLTSDVRVLSSPSPSRLLPPSIRRDSTPLMKRRTKRSNPHPSSTARSARSGSRSMNQLDMSNVRGPPIQHISLGGTPHASTPTADAPTQGSPNPANRTRSPFTSTNHQGRVNGYANGGYADYAPSNKVVPPQLPSILLINWDH